MTAGLMPVSLSSEEMNGMKSLKRLLSLTFLTSLALSFPAVSEEDDATKPKTKVADEFKQGDVVSAETFNQIFRTIERINKVAQDEDIDGSWICTAIQVYGNGVINTADWQQAGVVYRLDNGQLTFSRTEGTPTIETVGTATTSAPSVLWSAGGGGKESDSSTHSYSMIGGTLYFLDPDGRNTTPYAVSIVNANTIALKVAGNPANWRSSLICRSANGIPASPISPSATNKKTSLDIAWTDVSSDETGFKVYRTLSGEASSTLVATVTEAAYTDNDLEEGQSASYSVTSYNDNGESAKSKVITATQDSIPPTIIATSPANGDEIATDDRQLTITFSEKIEAYCPSGGGAGPADYCNDYESSVDSFSLPIAGVAAIRNSTRVFQISPPSSGYGGSLTASGSMMGSAESFQPNQTVTVKVNKDYIRDVNGNQLAEDYEFTFTVGED